MVDTYTKIEISASEYELIENVRNVAKDIQNSINNSKITISYLATIATKLQRFDAFTCRAIINSIHDNANGFTKQETKLVCKILRNELNL